MFMRKAFQHFVTWLSRIHPLFPYFVLWIILSKRMLQTCDLSTLDLFRMPMTIYVLPSSLSELCFSNYAFVKNPKVSMDSLFPGGENYSWARLSLPLPIFERLRRSHSGNVEVYVPPPPPPPPSIPLP